MMDWNGASTSRTTADLPTLMATGRFVRPEGGTGNYEVLNQALLAVGLLPPSPVVVGGGGVAGQQGDGQEEGGQEGAQEGGQEGAQEGGQEDAPALVAAHGPHPQPWSWAVHTPQLMHTWQQLAVALETFLKKAFDDGIMCPYCGTFMHGSDPAAVQDKFQWVTMQRPKIPGNLTEEEQLKYPPVLSFIPIQDELTPIPDELVAETPC